MLVSMYHLVGAYEVAQILGVSRQRVTQLAARDDFPAPVAILAAGKIWDTEEIEEWQSKRAKRLGKK